MRFTAPSRNDGAVSTLLHIGVPKTGTTSVQAALADLLVRDAAPGAGYGISMPGTPAEQGRAALSVLEQSLSWRPDEPAVKPWHWPRLVERARAAGGTVVVSSEFLCEARPEVIDRIVTDLGRDGLRVVVTLRPLGRILPSAWQQYLKSGHQLTYEKWLRAVLSDPPKRTVTPSFWRRHDHGAVVERWAEQVGPEQLTVIVLDESDRGLLLRTFDELLGLPVGTLRAGAGDARNRSMSAPEAELFRQVNVVLRRAGLEWGDYAHLVRYGAILRTVRQYAPGDGAERIRTPQWALHRARELAVGYVDRVDALRGRGLQVIGDLDRLAEPVPPGTGGDAVVPTAIPIEAAAEALLGVLARATASTTYFPGEGPQDPAEGDGLPGTEGVNLWRMPAEKLSTPQLGDLVYRRVKGGLRRRRRALASRITGTGPGG